MESGSPEKDYRRVWIVVSYLELLKDNLFLLIKCAIEVDISPKKTWLTLGKKNPLPKSGILKRGDVSIVHVD